MEFKLPEEASLKAVLEMRKYVYLPLLVVITIIALTIFIVYPNVQKIVNVRKQIEAAKIELTALNRKVGVLEEIDEEELNERLVVMERVLPTSKVVLGWMRSFNGLASETGVTLGSFALSPGILASESATPSADEAVSGEDSIQAKEPSKRTVAKSQLEFFDIALEIWGDYVSVVDFISGIEKISPFAKLTQFTFAPRKSIKEDLFFSSSGAGRLEAKLVVKVFYTPLPVKLQGVSTAVFTPTDDELSLFEELTALKVYEEATYSSSKVGKDDIFAPF